MANAGTYRVKGGSIRSKQLYVREVFGDAAAETLDAFLASRGVGMVLEANWYDYELFDAVLAFIAEHHFDGDLGRLTEIGRFSARHALTTTYEVFLVRRDLYVFFERLGQLHERFYNIGGLRLVARREDGCTLLLQGAPSYAETDIQVAAGFFAGAAELLGRQAVDSQIVRLPDGVRFELSWAV
ncbi:MAG: hypothetical protein AAGE94_03975 [Acidobacteriota bacterium]